MSYIPVVDFKEYGLNQPSAEEAGFSKEAFNRISKELLDAFKTVGFACLQNTGITSDQLDNVLRVGDAFFLLPKEVKERYSMDPVVQCGYVRMGEETSNPDRPPDLVEAYSLLPSSDMPWPMTEVPTFKQTTLAFYNSCTQLLCRVLDVINHGLLLKDPTYLRQHHDILSGRAPVHMRLNYYPSLTDRELLPNQIRLGEHTDCGSITLLFQDEAGGLEIQCLDGIYRPAAFIPDTVIVNIGDLMQRWTSDLLKANSHRVVTTVAQRKKTRRSVVFFGRPNDDCVIKCLYGLNKYPPVNVRTYMNSMIRGLYKT